MLQITSYNPKHAECITCEYILIKTPKRYTLSETEAFIYVSDLIKNLLA